MPVVLDISSDEEEGLKEEPKNTDFEWIQEMLFNSDDESDAGSDDVVILHETKPSELKSKSSTLSVKDDVDDDDDCVVLEGDPEKGVTSVNEHATGSDESDELVVVGEKGQVACRDYPHARHLCAKFPFSSTPHESHCGQCHCYVCDSLAPCLKWGSGISSSDHCHANDKTEVWKIQRKDFRWTLSSPLPASTNSGTRPGVVRTQSNEILPRDILHVSPISVLRNQVSRSISMHTPPPNCIPQNQVSRPKVTYAHYSLNSGMQNQISRPINIAVSHTATNLTRSTQVRDRNRPHSVPKQLLGVRSHTIQKEQGRSASSLRPQFLRSPMISKEVVGSMRNTLTANHSFRGSTGFNNHANTVQHDKFYAATKFSNLGNFNGPRNVCPPINLPTFSHSSSESVSLNCVSPHTGTNEPQAYGQVLSQSNDSQNVHQTCIQGNDAPYVACMNSNQHGNELQIKIQDENASGNITQSGVANQDTFQPTPHEESPNIAAGRFSAFDSSWAENISQSTEALIVCPSLQSSGSIDQQSNVEESVTQLIENVEPVNESSSIPSSIADFENWLSGNETGPMATNDILPFELNIPSPDPSPYDIDTGMFLSPWW